MHPSWSSSLARLSSWDFQASLYCKIELIRAEICLDFNNKWVFILLKGYLLVSEHKILLIDHKKTSEKSNADMKLYINVKFDFLASSFSKNNSSFSARLASSVRDISSSALLAKIQLGSITTINLPGLRRLLYHQYWAFFQLFFAHCLIIAQIEHQS